MTIPAEPAGGVAGALQVLQPAGDLDQDLVAGGVAVGVVDCLEIVQVAEQHGDGRGLAQQPGQGNVEPASEQAGWAGR